MADIANIGFRVDTSQLDAARQKVGQLFTDIGNLSNSTTRVDTAVTNTAQRAAQGADKQIQAYARTRKAIDDAAQQAQVAAQAQVQAMAQIGVSVTGVADRVDNSTARQVAAHGRTRKSVDQLRNLHQAGLLMISKGFMDLTDKVENSTQRQVAAHARTRKAMQKMATESRNAANTQIEVLRKIASETEKMSRAVANSLHNQKVQTQLLGRAMLDLNNGVRTSVTGKQLLNQTLADNTQKTQDFRVALLGTANAVAVLDGPLGGVASRISSFGILVGRFGVAGGALAATFAGVAMAARAAVKEFNKMETALLRLDVVVENSAGRIGQTAGQIYGQASDLAFRTLEDVEGSMAGINSIIGLSSVNAENMGRIMSNAADLSAMGFGDLASMARLLGRAVEDPERAVSRLNRRFNLFNETELETLRIMSELGKEAEVLDMVMAKIESRFKGVSEVGATIPYALDTIGQAMGSLLAVMGRDILEFTGLDNTLQTFAGYLQDGAERQAFLAGNASIETTQEVLRREIDRQQRIIDETEARAAQAESRFGRVPGAEGRDHPRARAAEETKAARELQLVGEIAADRIRKNLATRRAEVAQAREAITAVTGLTAALKEQNQARQALTRDDTGIRDLAEETGLVGFETVEMEDGSLVNVRDILEELKEQRAFEEIREDADKLLDQTVQLTKQNRLLAQSGLDLENMDTREASLRVMMSEIEGIEELSGLYGELETALQEYIEARDQKAAGAAVKAEERTMSRIGDAIRNQIELTRIQNNLEGLSSAELKVQEFIQAKISEMRGKMTAEEVLARYGEEVDSLREQLKLAEEIATRRAQTGQMQAYTDGLENQLATLQATEQVMREYGYRTEENANTFDALVKYTALTRVNTDGMTEAQRDHHQSLIDSALEAVGFAVHVDDVTNSTRAAANAATALARAMKTAKDNVGNLRDAAADDLLFVELLEDNFSQVEAAARVAGMAAARELLRMGGSADEAAAAMVETEQAALAAGIAAEKKSAALDALAGSSDGASDAMEELVEKTRDLLLSLDPAAQAAFDLSEKVGILDKAQAAGVISAEQYHEAVSELSDQFAAAVDPVEAYYQSLEKMSDPDLFKVDALEEAQSALADFLFDPFEAGIEGMVLQFSDALRRMAADALSAKIMEKVGEFIPGLGGGAASGGPDAALSMAATALNTAGTGLTGAGTTLSSSGGVLSSSAAALSAAAAALSASAASSAVAGSIPMMDKGGVLRPGQLGIVGEIGPELVMGPASVVGREDTKNTLAALQEQMVKDAIAEEKAYRESRQGPDMMGGLLQMLLTMLPMMLMGGGGFGGFFDQGGYIAPGKVGIAGEKGPELIAGPANVTSRKETSAALTQKAPEMNAKIINVLDPSIVGQYMATEEGEKLILNVLSDNGVI